MKNTKGITLVALVVTIIILIILAGVSINLVLGENGIITRAKQSKTITEESQLNEQAKLNEIVEYMENNLEISKTITSILKAGNYIKYNTGVASVGNNGVITCRVLYEPSSEYGLQIISDKNIATITLGGSDWTTGRVSYDSAIVTLNNEAEKYINTTYVTDARCVGSVPTNVNGTFTAKDTEKAGPVRLQFSSSVSGANNMKEEDTNYIADETQMKYHNIWTTGENYWLASRDVDSTTFNCFFSGRYVNTSGDLNCYYLCRVDSGPSTSGYSNSFGLRPCFALKTDIIITGGDGTSSSPYTM